LAVYHSRDDLLAQVQSLSERALADGVLIDLPRSRRRQQGSDPQKRLTLVLDGDQKRRMAAQIERFVGNYGKGLGWDFMLRRLEAPTTEEEDEARY
jgi:hypothetical protein